MIAAVVPAAGRSSRMGRPKLALPVAGRPMLERVITGLLEGGANPVVVVTGPHDPALAPLARAAGADVCELAAATPDMRTTVGHGLHWLTAHYQPRPDDAFLLTPGDIPFLGADTVRSLCEAWSQRRRASIVLPTAAGRRRHPALIGWRHAPAIMALPPGIGIDAFLRTQVATSLEVEVSAADGPSDLDTADDYEKLRR